MIYLMFWCEGKGFFMGWGFAFGSLSVGFDYRVLELSSPGVLYSAAYIVGPSSLE